MSGTSTRSAVLVGAACALAALLPIATGAPPDPPSDPISPKLNVPKSRLAIDGYDPVAYFPEGGAEPRKGEKNLTVNYRGATYSFATEANRERFRHEPSKYEPAYGGWCAYAMASDDRVEIDPKSFLIEDGSLLLYLARYQFAGYIGRSTM